MLRELLLSLCLLTFLATGLAQAHAQEAYSSDASLALVTEEVVVRAEAESDETIQGPFLPPVQGTKITSGKKTTVLDLDMLPRITNNNYRQALLLTPGLLLSEETSPLVSIGYRGLDPHRAQYTQVLKDGIPIHADQFGYPEAYYTPPLDSVDRIEFFRGGAALMFGPQPGGALNFVTHQPRQDRVFSFGTSHTFGSDNYYSTYNYFDGTYQRVGYYGYFHHRESDGFREANSFFHLNSANVKLVLDAATDSRWVVSLDAYEETHGEPGGLTFEMGPFVRNYNEDRNATTRFNDLFELNRYAGSIAWERDFSQDTKLTLTGWGVYYSRYSSRQRGGGFGRIPTGPAAETTSNERQEFYTGGFEARFRQDYALWGGEHTFAGGFQLYHTNSPREDRRGATASARGGTLRNDTERSIFYAPIFAENRFKWGAFSLTPGLRLENIWQGVEEKVNVDKTAAGTPLADEENYEFVPLFGVGAAWESSRALEFYGNVSQSYRPTIFTQAVPTGGTTIVPDDLNESRAIQYELGFRGNPALWLSYDVSGFIFEFDDQIGSIALPGGRSTLENVGRSMHRGIEAAAEVDLLELIDAFCGAPPSPAPLADSKGGKAVAPAPAPGVADRFGTLSLLANATLLDAEFTEGPFDGNTPRYAPDYMIKTGLIYRLRDRFQVAFLSTFVDQSFADDGNRPERIVPAYAVCDLTFEAKVYKDLVSVNAGINNLFDEDYYARVRDDGVDPAYRRNYYAGFSLRF